ncbi:MAG: hypothetical protein AMS18_16605 [Gemmatimonas sp. SG8_17]|nr:MAG: hypothetical protein AMS18_16605 [Gemmatimonas sp. SG8_17]
MFEADEGNTSSSHDQLTGIGTANAHHEADIKRTVDRELILATRYGLLGHSDYVEAVQEYMQITAVCLNCTLDHVVGVGATEFKDVVMPVRVQDWQVHIEVAVVGL